MSAAATLGERRGAYVAGEYVDIAVDAVGNAGRRGVVPRTGVHLCDTGRQRVGDDDAGQQSALGAADAGDISVTQAADGRVGRVEADGLPAGDLGGAARSTHVLLAVEAMTG